MKVSTWFILLYCVVSTIYAQTPVPTSFSWPTGVNLLISVP